MVFFGYYLIGGAYIMTADSISADDLITATNTAVSETTGANVKRSPQKCYDASTDSLAAVVLCHSSVSTAFGPVGFMTVALLGGSLQVTTGTNLLASSSSSSENIQFYLFW